MGALFGKKRQETLRPLTEKEIQQRLYGEFRGRESVKKPERENLKQETRMEPIQVLIEETRSPSVLPACPKRSPLSFSWSRLLSFSKNAFLVFWSFWVKFLIGLLNFLKTVLTKTGTAWGVGILIVISLFLAIHALNAYRAREMSAERSFVPSLSMSKTPSRPLQPSRTARPSSPTPPLSSPKKEVLPSSVTSLAKEPPASQEKGGRYVIQVAIYLREEDARRIVARMTAADFPSFIEPLRRPNGRTLYPVFLGRYQTLREAQSRLREFKKSPLAKDFPDSFVRSL